jgi:hypothetical protein
MISRFDLIMSSYALFLIPCMVSARFEFDDQEKGKPHHCPDQVSEDSKGPSAGRRYEGWATAHVVSTYREKTRLPLLEPAGSLAKCTRVRSNLAAPSRPSRGNSRNRSIAQSPSTRAFEGSGHREKQIPSHSLPKVGPRPPFCSDISAAWADSWNQFLRGMSSLASLWRPVTYWTPPSSPTEYDRRKSAPAKPPETACPKYDGDHTPTDNPGTRFSLELLREPDFG